MSTVPDPDTSLMRQNGPAQSWPVLASTATGPCRAGSQHASHRPASRRRPRLRRSASRRRPRLRRSPVDDAVRNLGTCGGRAEIPVDILGILPLAVDLPARSAQTACSEHDTHRLGGQAFVPARDGGRSVPRVCACSWWQGEVTGGAPRSTWVASGDRQVASVPGSPEGGRASCPAADGRGPGETGRRELPGYPGPLRAQARSQAALRRRRGSLRG